jgi:hypothetical protein
MKISRLVAAVAVGGAVMAVFAGPAVAAAPGNWIPNAAVAAPSNWIPSGAQAAAPLQIAAPAESSFCGAGYCDVEQDTDTGYCDAIVQFGNANYAYASFEDFNAGWDCTGWLERSTDGGNHWYLESGYHVVYSTFVETQDATGQYWDGGGYLARACFHLNFSGAATHCSRGI